MGASAIAFRDAKPASYQGMPSYHVFIMILALTRAVTRPWFLYCEDVWLAGPGQPNSAFGSNGTIVPLFGRIPIMVQME